MIIGIRVPELEYPTEYLIQFTVDLSPIILFVYNRPHHTSRALDSLRNNELAKDSDLFVFCDGPKQENDVNIAQVRDIVENVKGFKSLEVIKREENVGLAENIINGVTEVTSSAGRAIVLEDDLITAPSFLKYMNATLDLYQERNDIMSVSAYNHPSELMSFPVNYLHDIYLSHRVFSWGWGTWHKEWGLVDWLVSDFNEFIHNATEKEVFNRGGDDLVDMLKSQQEGKINSWAVRFSYAHFKNNAYSICPRNSYIDNIGFDGSGVHCEDDDRRMSIDLSLSNPEPQLILNIQPDEELLNNYRRVFQRPGLLKRIVNKLLS